MTETRRMWLPLVLCSLLPACSSEPSPGKPAPTQAGAPAAGSDRSGTASSPAAADCGPPVADQVNNVRTAVLDYLISRATNDALMHQVQLGPIVLAEEERQPSGGVFVHDVPPEVLERFAGRTPPVANYSSAFTVENGRTVRAEAPVAFVTGAICWTSSTRALVNARRLSSSTNQPFRATVEQRDGAWQVTSLADRR